MNGTNKMKMLGVFFCMIGIGYAGPVIADEGVIEAPDAAQVDQAEQAAPVDAAPDAPLPAGQSVEVGALGEIELHVKDLEITRVLQLLSIQSQRNIIASRNVTGTVSADLYGVDFYTALDAILHANGYGYIERGNIINVHPLEDIKRMQEAERQTLTRIVRLNYVNAADARRFLESLLSSAGTIAISDAPTPGFRPSEADGGANSFTHADTLVIRDYAENLEEIMAVLKEIDVRPKQVLVEATILEARLDEDNAFGVDFAIFTDLKTGDFANPLTAINQLIDGAVNANSGNVINTSPGNVRQGQSSIKMGFLANEAAVFIRALDSVVDTTVLSRPSMLVLNRQRASLQIGEKLGYLSTTATETTSTQTVEFLDVGTELSLRPFVSDDGMVRLELKPRVSSGDTTRVVDGFVIPDEVVSELQTNIIVRSGQTVVMGGLFKEDTTVARNQVPGVGNIPILGNAFKGQDDTLRRSEVIFLIKPTIVRDQSLYAGGEMAKDMALRASIGAREGLLPFSRTKLTNSYMQEAFEYLDQGNREKALWSVNKALYLDPTMIEALQLRERLTGERMLYLKDSPLRGAIDRMVEDHLNDTNGVRKDDEDDQADDDAVSQADELDIDDMDDALMQAVAAEDDQD